LSDPNQKYALIVQNARDYAIFVTNADGVITDWHEGAETVFGWTAEEAIGQPVAITFTPEDRATGEDRKENEVARRDGKAPNVRWHIRRDGSRVFIDGVSTALKNADGTLAGFLKIGQDATERQRSQERQRMLLAELQHRVRNTLAVVRSIVRRTGERSESVEDMSTHLQGRLDAFSRVQAAVTRSLEGSVNLASLIEDEFLAHAERESEDLKIEGPELALKPKAAEAISLAMHELATNAVKFGALSADRGRIGVRWERVERDGGEWLVLTWQESGIEQPLKEPEYFGFGLEMLQRVLPYELSAETTVNFHPEGLHFLLEMPLGPDVLAN
jgi:PAS domain S-box-containing protein